jgi:hypothetical protein
MTSLFQPTEKNQVKTIGNINIQLSTDKCGVNGSSLISVPYVICVKIVPVRQLPTAFQNVKNVGIIWTKLSKHSKFTLNPNAANRGCQPSRFQLQVTKPPSTDAHNPKKS